MKRKNRDKPGRVAKRRESSQVTVNSADIILHPKYRDRLDALLREQKEVLAQIEKERQKISRFAAASCHIGGMFSVELDPLAKQINQTRQEASRLARVLLNERKRLPIHLARPLVELANLHDPEEDDALHPEFEEVFTNLKQSFEEGKGDENMEEESEEVDKEELPDQQPTEKQRNPTLRELYLELSRAFHPDKAVNDEERARFHLYMRDINAWYKSGDMSSLIQFSLSVRENMPSTFLSSEVLSQEEERLSTTIEKLKWDLRILKSEYRSLRRMVPEPKLVDKVIKGKTNLDKEIKKELEETQTVLKNLYMLRDTLALVIRKKRPITALEPIFDLFASEETDEDDEMLDISEAVAAMMESFMRDVGRGR